MIYDFERIVAALRGAGYAVIRKDKIHDLYARSIIDPMQMITARDIGHHFEFTERAMRADIAGRVRDLVTLRIDRIRGRVDGELRVIAPRLLGRESEID